jgi:D-alanyl-D-alanine carboxypeptidase
MARPEPLPARQADWLTRQARAFAIPGLAVALTAPGRCSLFTCGVEAAGSDRAVSESTWFSVASLGKHVTACAVHDLARQGRLRLDDPVERHLADLPPAWQGRSVRSLLSHTSGLPEYLSYDGPEAVPDDRASFMRLYGGLAPAFDAGQGWIYTNTNYILAGLLVAQVSGQTFGAAVQSMFDRAGCPGATVASPAWTRQANAQGLGDRARDAASASREVIGDGDVSFTAAGALAWLQHLLQAPDALRSMLAPTMLQTGRPAAYGSGWFQDTLRAERFGHHGGHFDGWTAMAIVSPDRGSGVIVMCNLAPGNTRAVRHLAVQALEAWSPGSTPLSLAPLQDDAPALTATARAQLFRPGDTLDPACFADELLRVAAHGSKVRGVINLWSGSEPLGFELVEQELHPTHRLRRYRITWPERTERLLVGTTPQDRIYWAWPF